MLSLLLHCMPFHSVLQRVNLHLALLQTFLTFSKRAVVQVSQSALSTPCFRAPSRRAHSLQSNLNQIQHFFSFSHFFHVCICMCMCMCMCSKQYKQIKIERIILLFFSLPSRRTQCRQVVLALARQCCDQPPAPADVHTAWVRLCRDTQRLHALGVLGEALREAEGVPPRPVPAPPPPAEGAGGDERRDRTAQALRCGHRRGLGEGQHQLKHCTVHGGGDGRTLHTG